MSLRKKKQSISYVLAHLLGRPIAWDVDAPRKIHVFDADESERKKITDAIEAIRTQIQRDIGGRLDVIFHSMEETTRAYPEIRMAYSEAEAAGGSPSVARPP